MSYYQPPTKYDSAEWTQALATDYDVSAQTLFVNCLNPKHVVIRCDTAMTVKFNSTSNPGITINANTAFELDFDFYAMFITTTGNTAVKVVFTE